MKDRTNRIRNDPGGAVLNRFGFVRRIRLRFGIAATFTLIVVPLVGGMVTYLYKTNTSFAVERATESMNLATAGIVDNVRGLLSPVARIVEATALQTQFDPSGARRVQSLKPLYLRLTQMPHVYGFYVGFERDGAFYQIVNFPSGMKTFGHYGRPLPADARFAVRLLDQSPGERSSSYIYLAKWYDIVGVERGPAEYDPRKRPWFEKAVASDQTVMSPVYVFTSTGRPGLTLSHRATIDDGVTIGVAGADISLDSLSAFLAQRRVGKHGRTFIMDSGGRLVGYSDPSKSIRQVGDKVELVNAADVSDPVVAAAVHRRNDGAGDNFRAVLSDGKEYLVSFAAIPGTFGDTWTAGVIVQLDELVAPFRKASVRILAIGTGVVVVAIFAIFLFSRVLTRRLQVVVAETERIRGFDLDGEFSMRSRIVEIDDLARAVAAMKNSLGSFGAYVPKALVKSIVMSGMPIAVGGERRPLTVMFTDIKEFTSGTESMQPEDVLADLSRYFDAVSHAVHDHGGTIDKYIGDAVMAMWNAPAAIPDHAAKACRAMLACRAATRDFRFGNGAPAYTRFGLHTGEMVVGNVGSRDRMQYTTLGAEVNLASRVEALNKVYGSQLLVTDAVANEVGDQFLFRSLDRVVPAGTSNPIELLELLGERDPNGEFAATPADFALVEEWDRCLAIYRARSWPQAVAAFERFLALHPEDGAARLYIDRCRKYAETPPPADWDGAQIFKRK